MQLLSSFSCWCCLAVLLWVLSSQQTVLITESQHWSLWSLFCLWTGWLTALATDGGLLFYRMPQSFRGGYRELDHVILNLQVSQMPWMNLGYWKQDRILCDSTGYPGTSHGSMKDFGRSGAAKDAPIKYSEACKSLAHLLAKASSLQPTDHILDVGFGRGAQLVLWRQHYGVTNITGVSISLAEVEHARALTASVFGEARDRSARGMREGSCFDLRVGSATALPLQNFDNSFDKVLALDCAYHFVTRDEFFGQAMGALRPGGRLALIDIVLQHAPRNCLEHAALRVLCALSGVPRQNMCVLSEYTSRLRQRGFKNVCVHATLQEHVFTGFFNFVEHHHHEWAHVVRPSALLGLRAAALLIHWISPALQCVVVSGDKK